MLYLGLYLSWSFNITSILALKLKTKHDLSRCIIGFAKYLDEKKNMLVFYRPNSLAFSSNLFITSTGIFYNQKWNDAKFRRYWWWRIQRDRLPWFHHKSSNSSNEKEAEIEPIFKYPEQWHCTWEIFKEECWGQQMRGQVQELQRCGTVEAVQVFLLSVKLL